MGKRKRLVRVLNGRQYELVPVNKKSRPYGSPPPVGVRGFVPFVDDVSLDEIKTYLDIQSASVTLPVQVASVYGNFASNNFGEEYFFFNMKDVLGPDIEAWDVFGNVDQLILRMAALYDRIQSKRLGKKQMTPVSDFIEKLNKEDIVY
jgi:hypothetical protein